MANRLKTDWDDHVIASPWFLGRRYLDDVPLEDLAKFIDWTFFFSAWELKGRFPAILDHPQYGPAARELYENAQALLKRIIDEKLLTARGVYGFWPANTVGDDIVVYTDDYAPRTSSRGCRCCGSRKCIADGRPNRSLADFIAPRETRRARLPRHVRRDGRARRRRARAAASSRITTTTTRSWSRRWPIGWPRPLPSTCTRRRARTGATATDEQLSNEDLIGEKYRGIRPAYGYPACPDHTEKRKLFELLDAAPPGHHPDRELRDAAGGGRQRAVLLTPAGRSISTSAGSGRDQVESYAKRKGMSIEEAERWLAPNLAYEPAQTPVAPGA